MSEKIRVIVQGFGSIGKGVTRTLLDHKGIDIVSIIDMNPDLVGKDAGEVMGGAPLGVKITDDLDIYQILEPDIAIHAANSRTAANTFNQVRPALEAKANVIVANTPTCDLWISNPPLAKKIDAVCKAYQVTYCGFGVSHIEERMILAMAEGIHNIKKVTFTHYADISSFSSESNALDLGVEIDYDEWKRRKASGDLVDRTEYKENLIYIGKRLGWDFDEATFESIPSPDENNWVYALTDRVVGTIDGEERLIMQWKYVIDPDKNYYDSYDIEGVPELHSRLDWTPDRGLASTYTSIVNAIPNVINADPGYLSTLDVPLSPMTYTDFSDLIKD